MQRGPCIQRQFIFSARREQTVSGDRQSKRPYRFAFVSLVSNMIPPLLLCKAEINVLCNAKVEMVTNSFFVYFVIAVGSYYIFSK